MSPLPRPLPRLVCAHLWLLMAGCLSGAAMAAAPVPKAPLPPKGNEVELWSLRLKMTAAPPGEGRAALWLAVVNQAKRDRRLPDITVSTREGRTIPVADQLYLPMSGVVWVLRFRDGPVFVVRHWSGFSQPSGVPKEVPLEVPAQGEVSRDFNPRGALFGWGHAHEARRLALAGQPYCVTAVVEKMGLRSNTVFAGEPFYLPNGYDPLNDLKDFRRREAKATAEKARKP